MEPYASSSALPASPSKRKLKIFAYHACVVSPWLVLDVERARGCFYIHSSYSTQHHLEDSWKYKTPSRSWKAHKNVCLPDRRLRWASLGVRVSPCCLWHARGQFSHTERFLSPGLRHMNSHCTRDTCLAMITAIIGSCAQAGGGGWLLVASQVDAFYLVNFCLSTEGFAVQKLQGCTGWRRN